MPAFQLRPAVRGWLLASASGLALTAAGIGRADADPACTPTQQNIVSAPGSDLLTDGGGISIASGVVVNGASYGVTATICNATTVINSGILTGRAGVLVDQSSIANLINNGAGASIIGNVAGVSILAGSIGALSNSGYIAGSSTGLLVSPLNDSGTILASGTLGVLNNSGTIAATGSTIGGTTGAVANVGSTIGAINNSGLLGSNVSGMDSSFGLLNFIGTIGTLNNTGTIGGGSIAVSNFQFSNVVGLGSTIGTLNNDGLIAVSGIGVMNFNMYGFGGGLLAADAVIGTLNNTGTILADGVGVLNANTWGTLGGSISTGATIGSLSNSGTISSAVGVLNLGTGGTVGSTVVSGAAATIGTLTNTGSILGTGFGVVNAGLVATALQTTPTAQIGQLINSGLISGGTVAIANLGDTTLGGTAMGATIGSLVNSGTIIGSIGILNGASGTLGPLTYAGIGNLTNSGLISGSSVGIANIGGSIGTLSNSGIITGETAILSNGGWLGPVTNTGTILGNISVTDQSLSIVGASGSSFGVLSGATIDITNGDLLLVSGNQQVAGSITLNGGTGTFTNNGNLLLNSTVSLSGNYVQGAGAKLLIGLGTESAGRLNLTGTAAMTGAAIEVVGMGSTRVPGVTRLVLVDSATPAGTSYAGVTATATGYYIESLYTEMVGGHYDLVVNVSPASYTAIGRRSGALSGSMGVAADEIAAGASAAALNFQNQVLSAIDMQPAGKAQQDAVRSLAPIQASPHNLNFNIVNNVIGGLVEAHQLGMPSSSGPGVAAGSSINGVRLWAQAMGGIASRATTGTVDGYGTSHGGMMVGLDWNQRPDLLIGAGLSTVVSRTDLNGVSNGSKVNQDAYQLTAYGTYHLTNDLFAYGLAGAGVVDYRQTRNVNFVGAQAHARYNGQVYHAKAGLGYDITLEDMVLTPMAGLHYVRSATDAYTETGAGALNLQVQSGSADALTHDIGLRLRSRFQTPLGDVTPELRLAWTHDYITSAIPTSGVMAGVGFATSTQRIAADGARIGLSATLAHLSGVDIRAAYDGNLRSNYQGHAGMLRASLQF